MELELKCKCGAISTIGQNNNSTHSSDGWYSHINGDVSVIGYKDKLYFECKKCGSKFWIYG